MPSLDKVVGYTTIIASICTPPMLFFAAAVFFGWTPATFKGLGLVNKPMGIAIIALILGVCPWILVGYTYLRTTSLEPAAEPSIQFVPTELRLQFNIGDTIPVALAQQNVWRWYALATIFKGLDAKTKQITEGGRIWSVFLTFDKPTQIGQIVVDAGGGKLPSYEVKDSSIRTAVIVFGGEIAGVVVNIKVLPLPPSA